MFQTKDSLKTSNVLTLEQQLQLIILKYAEVQGDQPFSTRELLEGCAKSLLKRWKEREGRNDDFAILSGIISQMRKNHLLRRAFKRGPSPYYEWNIGREYEEMLEKLELSIDDLFHSDDVLVEYVQDGEMKVMVLSENLLLDAEFLAELFEENGYAMYY